MTAGGALRRAAGPLLLAAAFAAVAAAVALEVIAPAGPLDWDEGFHALFGLRAFEALRRFDLLTFLYDSYRSVYWPPLHSWLLAGVFSLAGASAVTARAASLAALAAAALFTFFAGRRIGGPAAGTIAALALIAAPGVAVLSGRAMLEVPALAVLAAALYASAVFLDPAAAPKAPAALAAGLLVFATMLAKTNYGVLLALALSATALAGLSLARRGGAPGPGRRSWLLAAAGLALPLAVWFAYTPKIRSTLGALANRPVGPPRFSPDGLLFYPRAAVLLLGAPLLVLLFMGTAAALARCRREPAVLCLALLAAFQLLFAELSATKRNRHLLPLVPALALLGGTGLAGAYRAAGRRGWAALAVGGAAMLAVQLPVFRASLRPATPDGGNVLLEALARSLPERPSFAVVGTTDGPVAPATLDFFLAGRGLLSVEGAASLHLPSEERALAALAARFPRAAGLLPARRRWPGPSSFTAYLGFPRGDAAATWTDANVSRRLAAALTERPADVVVAISGGDRSGSDATPAFWEEQLAPLGYRPAGPSTNAAGAILTAYRRGDPSGSAPSAPPVP